MMNGLSASRAEIPGESLLPLAKNVLSCHKKSKLCCAPRTCARSTPYNAATTMNAQDFQTIRGYVQVLPPSLGKEESARVAVIAEDGTEYHILHKGEGVGLFANINANVEVVGCIADLPLKGGETDDRESAETVRLVTVKSYRLTDGFDDPWYDDTVR